MDAVRNPELADLLERSAVHCIYQPVVDLDDRRVVAYEALMRGPAGSSLESPLALLEAARDDAEVALLDRLVHSAALEEMSQRRCTACPALFLNVEPRGIGRRLPDDVEQRWHRAREHADCCGMQVVIELTERALLDDPQRVLAAVAAMRDIGARLALDDVGAVPESLAFLPLIRPDVVKLDLRFVREHGSLEIAQIANAVRAYAEESGAEVVAEGVETEPDHQVALSLGATLGQGWLYGRPGPLPDGLAPARKLAEVRRSMPPAGDSPYEVVADARRARVGYKALLLPISHSLEDTAASLAIPPLLLGTFQHVQFFTPHTAERYTRLAKRLPLVAAMGLEMPSTPAPGVRGAALAAQDALAGEWDVVVLGAHHAAALVALDRGDFRREPKERRFDYVVTHDRDLVGAAAQTLLERMLRQSPADG